MSRPLMHQSMLNQPKQQIEQKPVTTVFVGNICERAPDQMIRQMLQRCGSVLNWKRAQGANNKLQAFGFCEFDDPESTLRCIRLLNGYELAEKKLLVKVDQKTRDLLSEHIKKTRLGNLKLGQTKNAKKAAALRKSANNDDNDEEINLECVDEDTLKEDRIVIGALELILRQYSKDLIAQPEVPVVAPTPLANVPAPAAPDSSSSDAHKTPSKTDTNGSSTKPNLVNMLFICYLDKFV